MRTPFDCTHASNRTVWASHSRPRPRLALFDLTREAGREFLFSSSLRRALEGEVLGLQILIVSSLVHRIPSLALEHPAVEQLVCLQELLVVVCCEHLSRARICRALLLGGVTSIPQWSLGHLILFKKVLVLQTIGVAEKRLGVYEVVGRKVRVCLDKELRVEEVFAGLLLLVKLV